MFCTRHYSKLRQRLIVSFLVLGLSPISSPEFSNFLLWASIPVVPVFTTYFKELQKLDGAKNNGGGGVIIMGAISLSRLLYPYLERPRNGVQWDFEVQ